MWGAGDGIWFVGCGVSWGLTRICTQRRSQQQQEAGAGGDGAVLGEAEGEGADALVERLGGAMDYTPGAAASSS